MSLQRKNRTILGQKQSVPLSASLVLGAAVGSATPLLPRIGAFPVGSYSSEITAVIDIFDENNIQTAVDFVHRLEASDGAVYTVCFRRFVGRDLEEFIHDIGTYGLTGTLDTIVGLKEQVTVTPKPNSSYLRISARSLVSQATVATPAPKPPTVSQAPVATGTEEADTDEDFDNFDYLDDDDE